MLDKEPTPGGLVPGLSVQGRQVPHHIAHKPHGPQSNLTEVQATTTEMGRLVADAGKRDWDELSAEYGAMLMEGLSVMGTRSKHVNVLQHLMGYLKNHLTSEDRQELQGLIEDYQQGLTSSTQIP